MNTLKHAFPLLLLAVFAVLLSDSAASKCFSSAESVKHAFPGSWPSWSTAGHKGKKCWFAALKRVHAEVVTAKPRKIKSEVIAVPSDSARLKAVISALVFPAPMVSFSDRFAPFDSFSDRFAAIAEVTSRPSYVQRLMDPVGVVP